MEPSKVTWKQRIIIKTTCSILNGDLSRVPPMSPTPDNKIYQGVVNHNCSFTRHFLGLFSVLSYWSRSTPGAPVATNYFLWAKLISRDAHEDSSLESSSTQIFYSDLKKVQHGQIIQIVTWIYIYWIVHLPCRLIHPKCKNLADSMNTYSYSNWKTSVICVLEMIDSLSFIIGLGPFPNKLPDNLRRNKYTSNKWIQIPCRPMRSEQQHTNIVNGRTKFGPHFHRFLKTPIVIVPTGKWWNGTETPLLLAHKKLNGSKAWRHEVGSGKKQKTWLTKSSHN